MSGPELNVQLGEVGKRIMEQRKRMGLTQKELAEKIGHTTQYVSYMETGKRTINRNSRKLIPTTSLIN